MLLNLHCSGQVVVVAENISDLFTAEIYVTIRYFCRNRKFRGKIVKVPYSEMLVENSHDVHITTKELHSSPRFFFSFILLFMT